MRSSPLSLARAADPAPSPSKMMGVVGRLGVRTLIYASICMLFLISPQRLHAWGIDYESPGGSPLEKVHPGTWAALLALALFAIRAGNPLAFFNQMGGRRGLTIFFATWLMLLAFTAGIEKTPFTPIIDAFLLPMTLFVLIVERAAPLRGLAILIHVLLTANGVLGVIEYLSGWRLTPFTAGAFVQSGDWRSTAFIGHPLANASITGAYILTLALGGGRDCPRWIRPLLIALQLLAMVAFGGRTALVMTLALLAGIAIVHATAVLRGRSIRLSHAALFCFFVPFVIGALLVAAQAGFFDRLLERFVDDNGSAEARVIMLHVFEMFPLRQILFGPDQTWLSSLQYQEGINYGIESFWIGFILVHGLIMSVIFFMGLAAFCVELVRASRPSCALLLVYFFGIASSSVSLSVKTCSFGLLVAVMTILMRRETPSADRAHRFAGARR